MLKKMTELVADILNYLPWGEISRTTANEVAAHLLENDVVPVVRCKDCKHFVADTKVGGKWIPVTERLSQKGADYLCRCII